MKLGGCELHPSPLTRNTYVVEPCVFLTLCSGVGGGGGGG